MREIIAFVVSAILLQLNITAQTDNLKKAFKKLDKGELLASEVIFKEIVDKNNTNALANYGMGKIFINSRFVDYNFFKAYHHAAIALENMGTITASEYKELDDYVSENKIKDLFEEIDYKLYCYVRQKKDLAVYNKFLHYCKISKYYKEVEKLRNALQFDIIKYNNTIEDYNKFIADYPNAKQIKDAKIHRDRLAFSAVKKINTISAYNGFMKAYPEADQVEDAIIYVNNLAFENAKKLNTVKSYTDFIHHYPNAEQLADAKILKIKLEDMEAWEIAKKYCNLYDYVNYLNMFPRGIYATVAISKRDSLIRLRDALPENSGNKEGRNIAVLVNDKIIVNCIAVEGNFVWVGTNGNGLYKYDQNRKLLDTITTTDGLSDNNVLSIAIDTNGVKWLGTSKGISRYDGNTCINYTKFYKKDIIDVKSIAIDKQGAKWFVCKDNIYKFDGKRWRIYGKESGCNNISCVSVDKTGNKWFVSNQTTGGINYYDGVRWLNIGKRYQLDNVSFNVVYVDQNDNKWFGSTKNGLMRFNSTGIIKFTVANGLTNDSINCIASDSNKNLWIGTEGGINKFDGTKYTIFTKNNGLPKEFIRNIVVDSKGIKWLGTANVGLYVFDENGIK